MVQINNIKIKVSLEQIEEMKHCIGFDRAKIKKQKFLYVFKAYRNRFAVENSVLWDELVQNGLARFVFQEGGLRLYMVTRSGAEFLGKILDTEIILVD